MKEFYECLGETCNIIDKSKIELLKENLSKEIDEDEEDIILEDFEYLCEIERKVMEISGILFKLFREPLTGLIAKHLHNSFLENWNRSIQRNKIISNVEVLSSICFFDDFIEYGAIEGVEVVIPPYLDNTCNYNTDNEDILQSIVYGYGVICKKLSKDKFKQYNSKIINYIGKIMQREVNEDNGKTYDNAVGAMGKYLIYQCEVDSNSLNMSKQFIKLIPVKNDLEEGKAICEEFFNQIKANHPLIVNDANMAEVKQSIADIKKLNDEKKFLEEQENSLKEVAGKLGI
jgi:hypothetical protein